MVDFYGGEIKSILIRSVNWIGDAILTTPAISVLRNNFHNAKISILAKPYVSEVFKENPDIDEIIPYEGLGIRKGFVLINELRKRGFDLTVLFQNAFEAALISFLSGIPVRLGYATDGRAFLLRPSIKIRPETKKKHHLDYYLDLLSEAGFNTERGPLVLNLKEGERMWAIDLLKKNGWNPEISKLVNSYQGQWVALTQDQRKIVGHSRKLEKQHSNNLILDREF
jgi:heptosyltransferase-2